MKTLSTALVSALIFSSVGLSTRIVAAQTCFTERDNRNLSFEVWQEAPPPGPGSQEQYRNYPATTVASVQYRALNRDKSSLRKFYWQWANHSIRPGNLDKGNGAPGVVAPGAHPDMVYLSFSTVSKANDCTMVQTATALGLERYAQVFALRSGLNVTTLVPEVRRATDLCIVVSEPLAKSVNGLVLDYEVQDGRSADSSKGFLIDWANLVHMAGREAMLAPNPWDAPTQILTGLTPQNAPEIASVFDRVSVALGARNKQKNLVASFQSQLRVLSDQTAKEKILLMLELSGTTLDDARTVHNLIVENHFAGIVYWRNGAVQGGDCSLDVNKKIGISAFGSR